MAVVAGMVALICSVQRDPLSAQPQRPAFRAGVDLVSLSVTVVDSEQRYVTDLHRDDFEVFENGVRQRLTFFGQTDVPLALALLLDTSASMEGALATAQEAAIGFVRQLEARDLATVIDFDSRVSILQEFTNNYAELEGAIRRTSAGGSTALYNAVYIALKTLNTMRLPEEEGALRRRAIILLSDGEDTASLVGFDEVLDLASRSDIVIYAIGLGGREPMARGSFQDAPFILRQLAQHTGGRAFFPLRAIDLAEVYGDIRRELSSQYSLAYQSSNPQGDGEFRRVAVRVNRAGTSVRTRPGYYAPRHARVLDSP
jgi:Ca-activated chloride channel family protein